MAIVAAEACTIMVTMAPTMIKMMMVKILLYGICANMPATRSPMCRSVAAVCRKLRPMNRKEKPKMNSPRDFLLDLLLKMSGRPKASSGMAKAEMFTLNPTAEIIHAVTVVPTLAPIITPMACFSVISPAFTKETTMTVVALDDWIRAVIRIPVKTPMTRFLVIAARIERSLSPANFSRPSLMIFIP